MPEYVAYTSGLRHQDHIDNEESDEGWINTGDVVTPEMFSDEDWRYHLDRGNIVRKGGPHDPEVLNASLEPEEVSEDPKDQEIRMLRQQIELLTGRTGTPAPGTLQNGLESDYVAADNVGYDTTAEDPEAGEEDETTTVEQEQTSPQRRAEAAPRPNEPVTGAPVTPRTV
jgi:hypothetical protein